MDSVRDKPTPETTPPETPYEMMGGERTLKRVVNRFYDIMDKDPRAREVRAMHAGDLAPMKEKLFQFLSGWLGGPSLYFQRPDAKCMGSVHAGFAIGEMERDQWMLCMRRALEDVGVPDEMRKLIDPALFRFADAVRTR